MKNKVLFTLYLLTFVSCSYSFLQAQNEEKVQQKLQAKKAALQLATSDTSRLHLLGDIAKFYILKASELDSGFHYAQKGLKLAQRTHNKRWEAQNSQFIGLYYRANQEYEEGEVWFRKALKQAKAEGFTEVSAGACAGLGNIQYEYKANYDSALWYFRMTVRLNQQNGDQLGAAGMLMNIAIIENLQGKVVASLPTYQEAYRLAEKLGKARNMGIIRLNMGTLYAAQEDYPSAVRQLEQAVHLLDSCQCDEWGLSVAYLNLVGCYREQKRDKEAQQTLEKGLRLAEKRGDREILSAFYLAIGQDKRHHKQLDSAAHYSLKSLTLALEIQNTPLEMQSRQELVEVWIELKRYAEAREEGLLLMALAERTGQVKQKMEAAKHLYRIDSTLGNAASALQYYQQMIALRDSTRNLENAREIGRLEAQYESENQIALLEAQRKRRNWILGSVVAVLLVFLILVAVLHRAHVRDKQINEALQELNHEIQIKNDKIEDSIQYASRIQQAILPAPVQLLQGLPPHFIHYQPRDIVSGDFYWMTRKGSLTFFATVDCTGHGVPGAFMSVLGANLLHQIVDETQISEPDDILWELNRRITDMLRQEFGSESKDGMDAALIVFSNTPEIAMLAFAGAGRPLWLLRRGEILEYKSASYSCGGSQHKNKVFPVQRIELERGDRIYLFSDGPVDQFGGPKGRKLGTPNLKAFLIETEHLGVKEQGQAFDRFFKEWMKDKKQLDDVLIAGFEV